MDKESNRPKNEFALVFRYFKWCSLALLFTVIIDLIPAVQEHLLALAIFNLIIGLVITPGILFALALHKILAEQFAPAIKYLDSALAITEVLNLIPGNPFAVILPDLILSQGIAYLGGEKFADGEKLLKRMISDKRMLARLPATAACRARLFYGMNLAELDRINEGEKIIREVIDEMESLSIESPEMIASSMGDLSCMLSRVGKSKAAIEIGNRAIAMQEKVPAPANEDLLPKNLRGSNQVQLSMIINNVAVAYDDAGQYERAQDLYQRSLNIKIRLSGENSKHCVVGYTNLACALLNQGQYYRALENAEKARKIATELKLETSRLWAEVLANCGDAHRALGQLDEAEAELLDSLKAREKNKDMQVHETWHELAKLYRDKNDFAASESYFTKAIQAREKRYGPDHPKVGKTLREYAKLLRLQNKETEAQQAEERAARITEAMNKELGVDTSAEHKGQDILSRPSSSV